MTTTKKTVVFLVWYDFYESEESALYGVFSTREKAEEYIKKNKQQHAPMEITEEELDVGWTSKDDLPSNRGKKKDDAAEEATESYS